MTGSHLMVRTSGNGRESLFECTVGGCDRVVVLDHVAARLTVITRGADLPHYGSTGLVELTGAIQG